MAVQFGIILALIAKQGLQAAIKKYGRSAVSKATSQAARNAAKKQTKNKNKEVLKKLDQKKIEEKAAETILKRKIEKEGVGSILKPKVTKTQARRNRRNEAQERALDDFEKEMAQQKSKVARQERLAEQQSRTADKERVRYIKRGMFDEDPNEFDLIEEVPLKFAEGGDVDAQMAMLMPEEEMMPEEEIMPEEQMMETPVVPDEEMEDDYLDFVVEQALEPEEQELLMDVLDESPQLSVIFDKLMDVATEFSGAGPVDGPGSGVSDSIPARLSDGEFVFTAKATEQIGADRLQSMMEDAEMEADAMRQEMQEGGAVEEKPKVDRFGKPVDEDIAEDEIRKGMMSVNPRLQ
jgi:hypothetical protein